MSDVKQNGHNSNRLLLSPLRGKDDGAFAVDMNSFYFRFDKHDFRSVIDDIISSTKIGGNQHTEEKDVLRVVQCTNVLKRSLWYFRSGFEELCHSVVLYFTLHLSGLF